MQNETRSTHHNFGEHMIFPLFLLRFSPTSGGAQVAAPAVRTRSAPKRPFRPSETGSVRRDTWPLSDIPFDNLDISCYGPRSAACGDHRDEDSPWELHIRLGGLTVALGQTKSDFKNRADPVAGVCREPPTQAEAAPPRRNLRAVAVGVSPGGTAAAGHVLAIRAVPQHPGWRRRRTGAAASVLRTRRAAGERLDAAESIRAEARGQSAGNDLDGSAGAQADGRLRSATT